MSNPDLFSFQVEHDTPTGEFHPHSLSTIVYQVASSLPDSGEANRPCWSERPHHITSRPTTAPVTLDSDDSTSVLKNDRLFAWDDVQVLWEVKLSNDINKPQTLSNLILKATEVLRFQWCRHFIIGFLVCGRKLKAARLDRSRILVGLPVNIGGGDGAVVFIKSIPATSVTLPLGLGIPQDSISPYAISDLGGQGRGLY